MRDTRTAYHADNDHFKAVINILSPSRPAAVKRKTGEVPAGWKLIWAIGIGRQ